MSASTPDRNLALELVRVTERTAIAAATARGLPVFWRGEALPALANARDTIAITGTHGKTTTTTMVATLLDAGQFDTTVINGGIIHASLQRLGYSGYYSRHDYRPN